MSEEIGRMDLQFWLVC